MLWIVLLVPQNYASDEVFIKIGVLSHRGDATTLKMWEPTANYLNEQLPQYDFEVIPLDFDAVNPAVETDAVDFILVNPGIYVNLEARYRVSRLATMNNLRAGEPYNIFGGVIFTRSDRSDIHTLDDLHDKSLMAVDATSLGGFQMAWREMKATGINPYTDLSRLEFGHIHDDVVMSVLDGKVDVGTVRTDILERMASAGTIDLDDIKIINSREDASFPFVHSTRLYPEWPFSKVAETSNKVASEVALALLQMPAQHPAALAGSYAGWTIPLDYQQVHALFRELNLEPYATKGKFTWQDALQRYWYWVLSGLLALIAMIAITSAVMRRNKRLERAKFRLERQYELILNSVADGIYGVDVEGNCTFVNQAMERLTGWSADDLIGKNQHKILHHTREDGSHHPSNECPVYQTFRDNRMRFVDDDIFWKKDGNSISVEYSCTPIKGVKGGIIGSVVVFRDTTERKQADDKSREHQRQLAHVARLSTLGEMASGIAHELNQPLTAIATSSRACVRMLESGQPSMGDCADVMERISGQAERAGSVIRHIRHFVHKELPERKPVRMQEILDTVVDLMSAEIRRKNIKLRIEMSDSVKWVLAQDIQIEQVILNLVRNAIEALEEMPAQKRYLTITAHVKQAESVEICVTDTGPGLKKEVIGQLFDPFVTTKAQGMGLGLSISHGIISNHGGQLRVKSTPGKGTRFYFSLPVAANPEATLTEVLANG
jgi:two-component system sensor histidine kinase TtrS